jgi:hypothetical protein
MTDLPPTRTLAENRARFARLENAVKGPKASFKTRVALVAHDRHLTKRQLAKFQKGRRFDFVAFAEAHDISLDWLIDGELRMHPRVPAPPREKKQPRQKTAPTAEDFLRLVRQLPPEDRPALLAKMRQLANRVTS